MIRQAKNQDDKRILEIYKQGVATGNATFETLVPDWQTWDTGHHQFCRLVYEEGDNVLGWGALSPVSARECYRGVAEISIYVDTSFLGSGIGNELMLAMIRESEKNGIWTLFSSIFPENIATYKLHLKHGFREIGYRERIARLDGKWRNAIILERRSKIVGV